MQVSAPVTSVVRQLHVASPAKPPAASDALPRASVRPLGKPVEEPPLAKGVRAAAEEILARRAAEEGGERRGSEGPNGRLRARLAELNQMVRRRLAAFAESRGAEDPQLREELGSISRTFRTAVREAWDAFRSSDGGKTRLLREVRAAFELAEAGFRFVASSSPDPEPTAVVDSLDEAAGAATPGSNGTFASPMSGVTVTVTAAPVTTSVPSASQEIAPPGVTDRATDRDPHAVLQEAIGDLMERFESRMDQLDELLTDAFGEKGEGHEESDQDFSGRFSFDLAMELYAEIRTMAGRSIGGLLDSSS